MGDIIRFPGTEAHEIPVPCLIYPRAQQVFEELAVKEGASFEEILNKAAALLAYVTRETDAENQNTGKRNELAIVDHSHHEPQLRKFVLSPAHKSSS